MKISVFCKECSFETPSKYYLLNVQDTQDYEIKCDHGHITYFVNGCSKYETLFEIACNAIIDGYHREAISSFSSSLERFYELFIKSSLYEKGHTKDEVDAFWSPISNQSERQLGAFVSVYTLTTGSTADILTTNQSSFRNSVIHKGKITDYAKTVEYGQRISDIIKNALLAAKKHFPAGVLTFFIHENGSHSRPFGKCYGGTTPSLLCPVDIMNYPVVPLEEWLSDLKYLRNRAIERANPNIENAK
ncbi:hypothetical protein [Pseudomonas sp. GL-R-19]|uniref:hypothetical protein n=1 Tax=Pseudomonas sp. GL-R-19 TaxID=2832391 RepID=UPI001CBF66F1|nr:hypothetical protein [Pseudomonas sp. GL-R-19]